MKKCTKCSEEKSLDQFGFKTGTKDGLNFVCKPCISIASKLAYEANKEKKKSQSKAYYNSNKTEILANRDSETQKIKSKQWREENREYHLAYKKEYRKNNLEYIKQYDKQYKKDNWEQIKSQRKQRIGNDPLFKLRLSLSKRVGEIIRNKEFNKSLSFNEYVGCSPERLFQHLETQFTPGMTWDNYGSFWVVDHIIPLAAAKNEDHLYQLSHYMNLQPLETQPNLIKSDKITKCWQKFQKDKNLEADKLAGYNFNLNPEDFNLAIEPLSVEHRQFIQKYEWLGKIGYGVRWVFTARHENKLAGVVMISEPNSYQFGEQEALIQRGAVSSWAPKNLNSKLVMFACRWMVRNTNKRYFVAYSDPDAGEIGTIYQACNFDYLGQNYGSSVYYKLPSGKLVTSRHFTRTSAMKRWAKELGIVWQKEWTKSNGYQNTSLIPQEIKDYANKKLSECPKVKQTPKGKYVLMLNYGKEKVKKLWEPQPYPKREK